jgi:diaminopimelate epimerase
MPGGSLEISIAADGEIRMRGPVEEICSGDLSPDLLRRIAAEANDAVAN